MTARLHAYRKIIINTEHSNTMCSDMLQILFLIGEHTVMQLKLMQQLRWKLSLQVRVQIQTHMKQVGIPCGCYILNLSAFRIDRRHVHHSPHAASIGAILLYACDCIRGCQYLMKMCLISGFRIMSERIPYGIHISVVYWYVWFCKGEPPGYLIRKTPQHLFHIDDVAVQRFSACPAVKAFDEHCRKVPVLKGNQRLHSLLPNGLDHIKIICSCLLIHDAGYRILHKPRPLYGKAEGFHMKRCHGMNILFVAVIEISRLFRSDSIMPFFRC